MWFGWYAIHEKISIHAPHEGERPRFCHYREVSYGISIHAPHEGERRDYQHNSLARQHISIHAPHEGERPDVAPVRRGRWIISIHAPHEGERRRCCAGAARTVDYFNPRSPRGGATVVAIRTESSVEFQSTLPTRGSDGAGALSPSRVGTISIHAPHEGERRYLGHANAKITLISIHAPHEGERPAKAV